MLFALNCHVASQPATRRKSIATREVIEQSCVARKCA